ncbi:MAG: ferrous iron transport protein B [Bacteroidia bacterium]
MSAQILKHKKEIRKIALVGNPNSGKSTLFNLLTGLNQKVGNFPGVTVEKKTGKCIIENEEFEIIDLPGTYSLHPKSIDEEVTLSVICDPANKYYPDLTIIVADASNLKRNLLLCSQIIDLNRPCILALNMMDLVRENKIEIDIALLSSKLGIEVIAINARENEGIKELKKVISSNPKPSSNSFFNVETLNINYLTELKGLIKVDNSYLAHLIALHHKAIPSIAKNNEISERISGLIKLENLDKSRVQAQETIKRYKKINDIIQDCVRDERKIKADKLTQKLDAILTHKVWGFAAFLALLFLIFQFIFSFSSYPMQWIEDGFAWLSDFVKTNLPEGPVNDLITEGIISGLGGIFVFITQIAFLFAFIAILEDTGYMARVSFILDRIMRRFGLNGRSVIPLISGAACAVPSVMSTRTISNWKERIITILVIPLISCSARLPVYTLLIALVIPQKKLWGLISYQGLVLFGLYLIGFSAALVSAYIFKMILKSKERSYFIMEMPIYRAPRWGTVALTMLEKVKVFLFDVGKVIISISIILWVLSSYAPGDSFEKIEEKYAGQENVENIIAAEKLEASYAGIFGKAIEPAIKPLGFDWKIGIALITSFAAREVFVGTMATIYSVGTEDERSLREKMQQDTWQNGAKIYSLATGVSLLLFYVFALQCMSTIAVVYRETGHWKWPLIQFLYMSAFAYFSSLIAYQLLS